ncbi:hypothetical protein C8F04DRAFT_1263883 [Mycena alexandri]|uniref:Uncharacterized protein n=1 Tax=Mycena alexandri TaxID=1745969 RepID=A0AAD6SLX3_9AGAR|nr:hypothetical protein C8F04DRAFT_1263883 [Mycena alexandri]
MEASGSAAVPESRPQAGPLPRKRGEIGFSEDMLREAEASRSGTPTALMPERHPEDRGATTAAPADTDSRAGSSESEVPPSTAPSLTTLASTSTDSISKKKRILHFLKPKKVPSYGGLRLTTLLAFAFQFCMFSATIVGWYFSISRTSRMSSPPPDSQSGDNSQQTNVLGNSSTQIFIHVVFGVATLVQLLFLERRVFRLRAERYSFVHPGEILPSARRREMGDPSMGFSPWNRPSLPTYAAALAQSGAGTGDVEDHLIAAAPPPAYGQTRGSTMLLSGFLRDSLRAQRPVSAQTQATVRPMSQRSDRGRPISYISVDEDWEEVQNAERARRLEETLSTLERPTPAHTAP